jgi:hypothetical protein
MTALHSLKIRLLGLWALSLVASVAVGILLIQLYRQSTEAQVARADAVIAHACDLIRDRFGFYASGWTGPVPGLPDDKLRADLATAIGFALARQEGVEGGIWQADAGPLAYGYPTYAGTDQKPTSRQRSATRSRPSTDRRLRMNNRLITE